MDGLNFVSCRAENGNGVKLKYYVPLLVKIMNRDTIIIVYYYMRFTGFNILVEKFNRNYIQTLSLILLVLNLSPNFAFMHVIYWTFTAAVLSNKALPVL
jgi:hypothetical protein